MLRGNEDSDGQPALVRLVVQPHGQSSASTSTPNPRAGQTRPYKSCRPSTEEEFNDGNA